MRNREQSLSGRTAICGAVLPLLLMGLLPARLAAAVVSPTVFEGGSERERAAVLSTMRKWGDALKVRDVDGMLALYEPDAIVFSSGRPRVVGHAAIRKVLARLASMPPSETTMHVEELSIKGGEAWATLLAANSVLLADGTTRANASRTVVIFRKGRDGVWRFRRDVDMPTPDAEVLLAGATPGAPGATAAKPTPQAHDLELLRRVHDAWIAAYTAGNVDALQRFYSEQTILMPDGRPTFRGWEQIRAFFAPGFERFAYQATADLQQLDVSGDLASAKGIVTVTLKPKAGGESVSRALRYLIVFRRVGPDDWRIQMDMDNKAP